jgi:photosystem II stability/assembly factor-like uncharacterized protein
MKKIIISLIIVHCTLYIENCMSQWSTIYTSNPSQTIMALKFYDNNTGYHSGVLYNGSFNNIYKTTNGGLNYTAQYSGYTAQRFMSIFILHPDTAFICGNYGKILKTVNGGNNWIPFVYSDTTVQFWGLFFVNSVTGYVSGSAGKILKTTNKGDNWITLNSNSSTALDGIYFVNENTGYVGGANIFLKTTDEGATWVNKIGNFISPFETAQAVYFSDVNTGYYCTNTSNSRTVKTTNGGDTWTLIDSNSVAGAGWDMSFVNANTGYICTGNGKVKKTTNAGVNWTLQDTPLTENLYAIHFPSVNTGYIASWSGKILKTTNGGATYIYKENSNIPEKFQLYQNYPNPFNSSTTIKFNLPDRTVIARSPDENGINSTTWQSQKISLKIFDITGKEIRTLVNESLEPGTYKISFNAINLPSGIYYYKLISREYSITKKMLLIK